ncbi:Choline/Carnitine o-acyltransferase-domain-containing protein [Suillus clintonianus]|uniref:Choline/Carnitine o-acyltransferase-domain-containing protein n=1 Tax=Suillus clintonianus TaxID=1904413 RepID=UPI001B85D70F|nr:Choline/Carnitine o-acyltransferase-domain-containing protein [Suillus clintonianus]KAG2116272.1 Choline/Carnitine o-acyltransferase-domain-containing protein [Suillus clintonianus]
MPGLAEELGVLTLPMQFFCDDSVGSDLESLGQSKTDWERWIRFSVANHPVYTAYSPLSFSLSATVIMMASQTTTFPPITPPPGCTFANQHTLSKLPVPSLDDTCKRYLTALRGLQDDKEHATTQHAVRTFLDGEGPALQERLNEWAQEKASCIQDFWYESYLSHSDPVVLALNPFFVLEYVSCDFICLSQPSLTPPPAGMILPHGGAQLQNACEKVARMAIGVLTTENRKTRSSLRHELAQDKTNAACLRLVDDALLVVCLDDAAPGRDGVGVRARDSEKGEDLAALCSNFLCGTYDLQEGVQVGTCTNRWYDKLQIIVCADGAAGINFEHTGVDGHTVLRFAADVFTEGLMLLARSINPSAPTLHQIIDILSYDTSPAKLMWTLTPSIRVGIWYAETRLSDLICQNDCQAFEFKGYGKNFITSHGFSPDAFVQMAFQAAYLGLYGRTECTYEPAMTKAFLHRRTEAIRTVQPESVEFTNAFFSECLPDEKIRKLCKACERRVKLTKECSEGLAKTGRFSCFNLISVTGNLDPSPDDPILNGGTQKNALPSIFADPGWNLLSTSILYTSNCGNPALRLFGFGPVVADRYGIGYIIKENGISVIASSKHLQTRRFLDTLQGYLLEVQKILIQLHRSANERPAPFVDHAGILHDSKTGRPIINGHGYGSEESGSDYKESFGYAQLFVSLLILVFLAGYSFFDSGDIDLLGRRKRSPPYANIGKVLPLSDY